MIKCDVKICGTVSKEPVVRDGREGGKYISLEVQVPISNRSNERMKLPISVTFDNPDAAPKLKNGCKVVIEAAMYPRKKGDNIYFNAKATSIGKAEKDEAEGVSGNMLFKGTAGNKIDQRSDRNGNPWISFSGFSAEKDGEEFAFIWVRFVGFGTSKPEWLEAKTKIEAEGQLEISPWKGKPSFSCTLSTITKREVKEYDPSQHQQQSSSAPSPAPAPAFAPQSEKEDLPF